MLPPIKSWTEINFLIRHFRKGSFSKGVLKATVSILSGYLLAIKILEPHLRPVELKFLVMGPRNPLVNKNWLIGRRHTCGCTKGNERPKKEADHSALVGGRFSKRANLPTRLALGGGKMSRPPHPPTRFLKVYVCVPLLGFRHTHIPSTESQPYLTPLEHCDFCPRWAEVHSKDRPGGEEPLIAWVPGRGGQPVITSSWWPPPKICDQPTTCGVLLLRMPSSSVTTHCIIPFLGGICGRQADYNMKWIFSLFSLTVQHVTCSFENHVRVREWLCLYRGAGTVMFWKSEVMLLSEWNAYLQSPSA